MCDGDGGFSVVEDALFISAGTRAHERLVVGYSTWWQSHQAKNI